MDLKLIASLILLSSLIGCNDSSNSVAEDIIKPDSASEVNDNSDSGNSSQPDDDSITNEAPQISGAPTLTIEPAQTYSFMPQSTDNENDQLTYNIVNKPSWLIFDNVNGQLSGTAVQSDIGVYSNIIISVTDGVNTTALPPFTINVNTPVATKKGVAFHRSNINWSQYVASLKPHWSYSWGLTVSQFQPDNVEFVPMRWRGDLSAQESLLLQQQYAQQEIYYLLGYNEPDGSEQANMTVAEAVALWPQLEATGLPLISPSPVSYNGDWMKAFMTEVDAQGLRVDYLGYHSYAGANAQGFLNKLEALNAQYGRPIWITEFAVADWSNTEREENKWSEEQILDYMKIVLPELDKRDYITRYAWFTDINNDHLWTSALIDETGNLTNLGEYYASHSANTKAGTAKPYPVVNDTAGNLLTSGNFELGIEMGWDGYSNKIITLDETITYDGAFCGLLEANKEAAFLQEVDLIAGVNYAVSIHTKWAESPSQNVNIVVKQNDNSNKIAQSISSSTDWTSTNFTYLATESGKHKLTIWTGANVSTDLYVDAVVIKQVQN